MVEVTASYARAAKGVGYSMPTNMTVKVAPRRRRTGGIMSTAKKPVSVEGSMKQTSKTAQERGEASDANENSQLTSENETREGDKPVDQATTGGSSPYEEPHHRARSERSD